MYARLLDSQLTPIIALNYAVAVAMAHGLHHGLALIEQLEASGELNDYYLMWSAKADLLRRMGRFSDAATAYRRALEVVSSNPDRRFLARRLAQMESEMAHHR